MSSQLTRRLGALFRGIELIVLCVVSLACFVLTAGGAALVVVWVGIPILVATEWVTRHCAAYRRKRVGTLLRTKIESPYLRRPPGNPLVRVTGLVADPAVRRDALWLVVDGTLGLALAIIAFVESLLDLVFWWLPVSMAGRVHAHIDRRLLSVSEKSVLALRVEQLTESRADTLDSNAAELRRIERDLHDGAQARLVSLGLSLAMAEELQARDPDAARALLTEARATSSDALAELRDLVRGILPPVLADRGLAGAVQALALAAPMPVLVTTDLVGRLPAPVESAAYFAVAEALTNVIKHAAAEHVCVGLSQLDDDLALVVEDDGRGGADIDRGTGLRGIARRLSAFDGTLAVTSPDGGPTKVVMVLPCASSSPKTSPSSGTA